MNKKLARFIAVTSAAFLLSGVVACGGGGGGDDPGPTPGPTPTKTVEINFWHTFGQLIQDNLEPQITAFKEAVLAHDNVKLNINLVPHSNYDSIKEQIDKGLVSGNIPTLAVGYPDHVAGYMYAEDTEPGKFVVNLESYINDTSYGLGREAWLGDPALKPGEDPLDDFIDAYIDGGRHFIRNGIYTFPYMKSTEAMLFNFDALTKVLAHYKEEFHGSHELIQEYMDNLDWAEFMNLCSETWKYRNEINPKLKIPAFYDSDGNLMISQMMQGGVAYSSINTETNTGRIDYGTGENREKAEKIAKDLKGWFDNHLFTTRGADGSYGSDSFKNVESVFTIGSTGGSGYSLTNTFEIGVCKVPSLDDSNPTYVCQGPDLCLFNNPKISAKANSDRVLYAWKLIKFLTNPANNVNICINGSEGYLPVRESAYYTDAYVTFLSHENEPNVKIANCVTEKINGNYYSTSCFMGSADLRKETGGILTEILLKESIDDDLIHNIFQTGIDNATLKIK